jgi:hypothetical protein
LLKHSRRRADLPRTDRPHGFFKVPFLIQAATPSSTRMGESPYLPELQVPHEVPRFRRSLCLALPDAAARHCAEIG